MQNSIMWIGKMMGEGSIVTGLINEIGIEFGFSYSPRIFSRAGWKPIINTLDHIGQTASVRSPCVRSANLGLSAGERLPQI